MVQCFLLSWRRLKKEKYLHRITQANDGRLNEIPTLMIAKLSKGSVAGIENSRAHTLHVGQRNCIFPSSAMKALMTDVLFRIWCRLMVLGEILSENLYYRVNTQCTPRRMGWWFIVSVHEWQPASGPSAHLYSLLDQMKNGDLTDVLGNAFLRSLRIRCLLCATHDNVFDEAVTLQRALVNE